MFEEEFNSLLDDENELYQLFIEHHQYQIALTAALAVLKQHPLGLNPMRGLLILQQSRSQGDIAELIQKTIDDLDNGLFDLSSSIPQQSSICRFRQSSSMSFPSARFVRAFSLLSFFCSLYFVHVFLKIER